MHKFISYRLKVDNMIFYFNNKNTVTQLEMTDKGQMKSSNKLFIANHTEGIDGIKSTLFVR